MASSAPAQSAGREAGAPNTASVELRCCAIVPTFDNPATIRKVVTAVREHIDQVIVVDDGSGEPGASACRDVASDGLADLVVRDRNGGKGAAVKDGLARAHQLGFTHALQVDADGQHNMDDIPRLLDAARNRPSALVLGAPIFDPSAPRIRRWARKLTSFWVHVETGGRVIADAMCGFRVYPVADSVSVRVRGDAMDFDPEIAVRLHWAGVPIENVPTPVRYIAADQGGVSHFRQFRDNALISWMHTRLVFGAVLRVLFRRGTARAKKLPAAANAGGADDDKAGESWLTMREKGTALGIRFLVFCATVGGRRLPRLFLRVIALYYALLPSVRRASRSYLERIHQSQPTFRMVYRHVWCFAACALDRLFLVKRRFDLFEFTRTGEEHLAELRAEGRGAILLGAHLGSFEAMRALSHRRGFQLNVVGYFKNARTINHALEGIDPECNTRFISIDQQSMSFVFKIKECIERGELVAILGDRVGLSGKTVTASFLGDEAPFPAGLYALCASLGCPVYLTFGLHRAPNHYDLHCEPFADRIVLPRKERALALAAYAQEYADRLAHYCRKAPDNWFNFYDFWLDKN